MHDLLRAETAVRLDLEVELARLRVVVVRLLVEGWVLFLRIFAEWPFVFDIRFVPPRRVAKFVVWVIFKGDG